MPAEHWPWLFKPHLPLYKRTHFIFTPLLQDAFKIPTFGGFDKLNQRLDCGVSSVLEEFFTGRGQDTLSESLSETPNHWQKRRRLYVSENMDLMSDDWILSRPQISWAGSKWAARCPIAHPAAPDVEVAKSPDRRENKVCACFSVRVCCRLFPWKYNSYIWICCQVWFYSNMLETSLFESIQSRKETNIWSQFGQLDTEVVLNESEGFCCSLLIYTLTETKSLDAAALDDRFWPSVHAHLHVLLRSITLSILIAPTSDPLGRERSLRWAPLTADERLFLHQMSVELHPDATIQSTTVGGSKPLHYFMKGQPKVTGVCLVLVSKVSVVCLVLMSKVSVLCLVLISECCAGSGLFLLDRVCDSCQRPQPSHVDSFPTWNPAGNTG